MNNHGSVLQSFELVLNDESDTVRLGSVLSTLERPFCIYLLGDLGAGKTTLVKHLLTALGHSGNVKSPTYTIVETYQIGQQTVQHFDLYRLEDPEELEFIGVRELDPENDCLLFEWPEKGQGWLPAADLTVALEYNTERQLSGGKDARTVKLLPGNQKMAQQLRAVLYNSDGACVF